MMKELPEVPDFAETRTQIYNNHTQSTRTDIDSREQLWICTTELAEFFETLRSERFPRQVWYVAMHCLNNRWYARRIERLIRDGNASDLDKARQITLLGTVQHAHDLIRDIHADAKWMWRQNGPLYCVDSFSSEVGSSRFCRTFGDELSRFLWDLPAAWALSGKPPLSARHRRHAPIVLKSLDEFKSEEVAKVRAAWTRNKGHNRTHVRERAGVARLTFTDVTNALVAANDPCVAHLVKGNGNGGNGSQPV